MTTSELLITMKNRTIPYFGLLGVTIIWGATFPIIHNLGIDASPVMFVFIRFAIASVIMWPFVYKYFAVKDLISLKYGCLLGIINSGSFLFQTIALKTLDSTSTAFLTTIYVIFVPLLLPLFGFRRPKFGEYVAAIICLYGIYLISGIGSIKFQSNDLWVIASTLCIALGLIVVEHAADKVQNVMLFNFYQIFFTTVIPLIMLMFHPVAIPQTIGFWLSVGYCAVLATVIAFFLQLKYQACIGASKTALIFSLEAVFAAIIAWLFGENISERTLIGGGVILISIIGVDLIHKFRHHILSFKSI